MRPIILILLTAAALSFSGCGEDKPPASSAGKQVFSENCASCHTLSAAGSKGVAGPNLDQLSLSQSQVEAQVQNGGGGMPAFAGSLSPQQIEQVADYVSSVSGSE